MTVDFDKGNGLVPAIIQDNKTKKVLMLGYMNAEALAKTQLEKKVKSFKTSQNGRFFLWIPTRFILDCLFNTKVVRDLERR